MFSFAAALSELNFANEMKNKVKILIIDDEPDTLEFISYQLRNTGFEILTALNGIKALEILQHFEPKVILVDYMMPEMDGFQFLKRVRADFPKLDTRIAFLTAKSDDDTQVRVLDTGADDFIAKPVKTHVLVSRINALLRRGKEELKQNETLVLGDLKIDPESFLVYVDGRSIDFPRKEFQLLYLLAEKPGKVFKREEILSKIWGNEVLVGERTIDVHIRKIRERLDDRFIKTIKGIGYKLDF